MVNEVLGRKVINEILGDVDQKYIDLTHYKQIDTKPICRQSVQHRTNHVDGELCITQTNDDNSDKLKDIDRKMYLYHRGDISSTDDR